MKICTVDGCNNTNIAAKGMCWKHYRRFLRHNNISDPDFINKGNECSLEWCDNPAYAKGLCEHHHHKLKEFGDPTVNTRVTTKGKTCAVKNCNNKVYAKGLCQNHYRNFNRYKKSRGITAVDEYLKNEV